MKHQIDALEQTKDRKRVAYYLDMGLGKTFVGAEKMYQIGNWQNIVVCQKSKINDWVEHFEKYYDWKVFDCSRHVNKFFECKERKVGVINYDLIWRRDAFSDMRDFTLMLDESSEIQNRTRNKSKFILKLKPNAVILLSGTPVGGKYENLWSQWKLLGYQLPYNTFENIYVNKVVIPVGRDKFASVVDKAHPYKNVERLKNKLRESGAVFLKTEEVFDLPEQTFITVKVPKPKKYKRFLKEKYLYWKERELKADTTLTKLLGCRQLCGSLSDEKIDAVKDLLNSSNDRFIIFYNFNDELEKLKEVCKDRPISVISGNEHNLNAYENEDDSVTLVQYQAGAKGLNLQKANKMIYFTLPLSSENFEQSKKRIHRIGQNKPCTYYLMICQGSVEPSILAALERKRDFTNDLFIDGC